MPQIWTYRLERQVQIRGREPGPSARMASALDCTTTSLAIKKNKLVRKVLGQRKIAKIVHRFEIFFTIDVVDPCWYIGLPKVYASAQIPCLLSILCLLSIEVSSLHPLKGPVGVCALFVAAAANIKGHQLQVFRITTLHPSHCSKAFLTITPTIYILGTKTHRSLFSILDYNLTYFIVFVIVPTLANRSPQS